MFVFIILTPVILLTLPFLGLILILLSPLIVPTLMVWGVAKLLKLSWELGSSMAKYDKMVIEAREKLIESADALEAKLLPHPLTTPNRIHLLNGDTVVEEFDDGFRLIQDGQDSGYQFETIAEAKGFVGDVEYVG